MGGNLQETFAAYSVVRRAVKSKVTGGCTPTNASVGGSIATSKSDLEYVDSGGGTVVVEGQAQCISEEKPPESECDTEHLPISCVSGRYVFLYLTPPLVRSTCGRMSEDPVGAVDRLCSPSTSVSPRFGAAVESAAASTGRVATTVSSLLTLESTVNSPPVSPSCSVVSSLVRFCKYLCGQQEARSDALTRPVAVLEVRKTVNTGPRCGSVHSVGDKRQLPLASVEAAVVSPHCGGDLFSPADDMTVTNVVNDFLTARCQRFCEWFYLESSGAYQCAIQNYDITSWPAVLLFSPTGELLTTEAYCYIDRELSAVNCREEPHASVVAEEEIKRGAGEVEGRGPQAAFCSGFPWVFPDPVFGRDVRCITDGAADASRVWALVRHLLRYAHHVNECIGESTGIRLEMSYDGEEKCQAGSYLGGAERIALYFGSSWHPASKRFLPHLKRLWSAVSEGSSGSRDLDDGCGTKSEEGDKGPSAYTTDAGGSYEPLGIDSWRLSAVSDALTSVGMMDSDVPYLLSRCSGVETPTKSPREQPPTTRSSPKVTEDGRVSSTVLFDGAAGGGLSRGSCELQVIFVSADADAHQLGSSLHSMPHSWLFVSSVSGPGAQAAVNACLEFFNVRVFPRLVLLGAMYQSNTRCGDAGEDSICPRLPISLKVEHSHAEMLVVGGGTLRKPPSRVTDGGSAVPTTNMGCGEADADGPTRPTFHRYTTQRLSNQSRLPYAMKSLVKQGGSLLVLCCLGNLCPDLYARCLASLSAAGACQVEEASRTSEGELRHAMHTPTVRKLSQTTAADALTLNVQEAVGPCGVTTVSFPLCCTSKDGSTVHAQRGSDELMSVALEHLAGDDANGSSLPMYFVDAVAVVRGDSEKGVVGGAAHSGSWSQHGAGSGLSGEDRELLQEYVISEVLEADENLLPPFEGEPFLVYLQWPERRVDVLRRLDHLEPSLTSAGGSLRSSPATVSPVSMTGTLGTQSPDGTEAGTHMDGPAQSPLCSPALVRSFIKRCAMRGAG